MCESPAAQGEGKWYKTMQRGQRGQITSGPIATTESGFYSKESWKGLRQGSDSVKQLSLEDHSGYSVKEK